MLILDLFPSGEFIHQANLYSTYCSCSLLSQTPYPSVGSDWSIRKLKSSGNLYVVDLKPAFFRACDFKLLGTLLGKRRGQASWETRSGPLLVCSGASLCSKFCR